MWPGFGWQKGFGQDLVKKGPFPLLPHKEFIRRMATIVLPGFGRLAKTRKSKESKDGQEAPAKGPGHPRKAAQGAQDTPAMGATGDGQEALAKGLCTTQGARKHRQSHAGGPRKHEQTHRGGQQAPAKPPRGGQEPPAKIPGGARNHRQKLPGLGFVPLL